MNATWFAPVLSSLALVLAANASAQFLTPRSLLEDFGTTSLGAAPSSPPPALTQLGLSLIMDFEGWRASAYDDPVGLCTIGYGHLIAKKRCQDIDLGKFSGVLTRSDGEDLLHRDTESARAIVHSLVNRLINTEQYSALSSFAFNVGKRNFAESTLLKLVNDGKFEYAEIEFNRWVKAGGLVLKGLQDRRACESKLFSGKLKAGADGGFKRAECALNGAGAAPALETLYDIDVGEQ